MNDSGNRSQPPATVFAYVCGFRGGPICDGLPPVATTGLLKGSILRCLIWRRCAFGERFAKRRSHSRWPPPVTPARLHEGRKPRECWQTRQFGRKHARPHGCAVLKQCTSIDFVDVRCEIPWQTG